MIWMNGCNSNVMRINFLVSSERTIELNSFPTLSLKFSLKCKHRISLAAAVGQTQRISLWPAAQSMLLCLTEKSQFLL